MHNSGDRNKISDVERQELFLIILDKAINRTRILYIDIDSIPVDPVFLLCLVGVVYNDFYKAWHLRSHDVGY